MSNLSEARLYGILDLGYVAADQAENMTRLLLEGGVDLIQLRAKGAAESVVADLGRKLAPLCQAAGTPFILNDYPHLVPATGADGVHVGQDDMSLDEARKLAGPGVIVGKSTHSPAQAAAAREEGADYIGFGPLFSTPTKPEYVPVGLDDIRQAQELSGLPVFCIGGIKLENLPTVLAAGAQRVVIVSGILAAPDPVAYIRACRNLLTPA